MKLPLLLTVGRAYTAVFVKFPTLLRISWFWLLVIAAIVWVFSSWIPGFAETLQTDHKRINEIRGTLTSQILDFVSTLLLILPMASIAVNWHRMLLRDEEPAPNAWCRLDAPVLAYAMAGVILLVISTVISHAPVILLVISTVISHAPSQAGSTGMIAFVVSSAVLSLVACFFSLRLFLVLPARALELDHIGFEEVWARTHGNTWRIVWSFLACYLPVIAVAIAFMSGPKIVHDPGTVLVFGVLMTLVTAFCTAVYISLLSFSHEHFFGKEPERLAAMVDEEIRPRRVVSSAPRQQPGFGQSRKPVPQFGQSRITRPPR